MRLGTIAYKYKINQYEIQACLRLNGIEISPSLNVKLSTKEIEILDFVYGGIEGNGFDGIISDHKIILELKEKIEEEIKVARIQKELELKRLKEEEKRKFEEQLAKEIEEEEKAEYENASAFVTNSTANSVCFFAMAFLNDTLTPWQIQELRNKLTPNNLKNGKFDIEELKSSFLNQSAYFLNIHARLTENDRFSDFASNLEKQGRLQDVFRKYNSAHSVIRHFNRRIFHVNPQCESMLSDYDEDDGHFDNTGVFGKDLIKKYYVVKIDFLNKLKMVLCKKCNPHSAAFTL